MANKNIKIKIYQAGAAMLATIVTGSFLVNFDQLLKLFTNPTNINLWFFVMIHLYILAVVGRLATSYFLAAIDYPTLKEDPKDIFILLIALLCSGLPLILKPERTYIISFFVITAVFALIGIIPFYRLKKYRLEDELEDVKDPFIEYLIQKINILVFLLSAILSIGIIVALQYNFIITSLILFALLFIIMIFNIYNSFYLTYRVFINIKDENFITRRATKEDTEVLTELILKHFGYVYNYVFGLNDAITRKILKRHISFNGLHSLGYLGFHLIIINNEVIGFYKYSIKKNISVVYDTIANIRLLFILWTYAGVPGIINMLLKFYKLNKGVGFGRRTLYLDYLCIDKNYQNQGIGSKIIKNLEAGDSTENDYKRMKINLIKLLAREKNINANSFFLANGFSKNKTIRYNAFDIINGQGVIYTKPTKLKK